jgi:DNA primase large subunit
MEKYDVEMHNGRCQVTPYTAFMVIQDLFEETLKIHRECLQQSYNNMLKIDFRMTDVVQSIIDYKAVLDENIEIYYDRKERFDNLTADSVSHFAINYFPLCMLEIHDALKKNHSLKHWGRLQFGMFLKGVGLDVKETIRLFTNELKKTGKGEKQVKEYVYYIEHMYGIQGKKTDYTPWSCQKIMGKASPAMNESYGCPFVYYSDKALIDLLKAKKNLSEDEINRVLESKKIEPSLACRKVFELTHPGVEMNKGIGKHPNGYFKSSYWYHEMKNKETMKA